MVELAGTLDSASLGHFRDAFAGHIVLPDDLEYDTARRVWNGMIDRRPAIVVRPTSHDDVATAIRFGRDQDLVIAIRCGGHSMAGQSTCNGGIVIDLSRMRGATVDPERRTARVLGGSLLSELDEAAQAFGLACPVGVVGHTGVAGLTLGGGMGRLQRKLGFTIDNLLAVELVTADGRFVRATESEHPDLFWGLRGAGANFGVATAFEFALHPVGPTITRGTRVYPADRARELWMAFEDFSATAPDEISATFNVFRALPEADFPASVAGQPVVAIGFTHCGSAADAESDLAALDAFGDAVAQSMTAQPYLEVQRLADEAMAWGHRVYTKGTFVDDLPGTAIDAIVDQVAKAPSDDSFSVWAQGGAIARVPDDAMAFTGRAARFDASAESLWDEPELDEAHMSWARGAMALVQPHATVGQYVNEVAEATGTGLTAIYGDAKRERLVGLKRAWDPDNVFRLNQNIEP